MLRVLRRRSHTMVAVLAASVTPVTVAHATKRLTNQVSPRQISSPVLAVVSVKDQRISLYDASGAALRARVSTGQTGLETPSGVYAVLQKEVDHHSNVYDDAAMPFMQRITWSGIALHAGALPGYPASHGCVRLPYAFAQQIYSMTRLGMRVVISPDDFAPVAIAHPFLLKPSPPSLQVAATAASFAGQNVSSDADNPFQPDVRKWPERQAELEALKSVAAAAAAASEKASARVAGLKVPFDTSSAVRAKAAKALRSADIAKRSADDQLGRAVRLLSAAQIPRSTKAEAEVKAKAVAASQTAGQAVDDARAAAEAAESRLAMAQAEFDTSADNSPRRKETKRALDKQTKAFAKAQELLRAAQLAKRKANDRVADADRALFAASQPRPTKREEDAKAKALAIASDANAKYAAAATQMQDTDRRFKAASDEYNAAGSARISAAATAQQSIGWTEPVSIFVSLKTKRLYIRQAHTPVLDVPITIADPNKPTGTHVFTAVAYTSQGDDLRWTAVSIGRNSPKKNREANLNAEAPPTDVKAASAALDRLTMPPEVLRRISGHVWPGSSIIVSDEPMSSETGVATDFVIVMNNEPQGGLKSRAAEVAASRRKSNDDSDDDDDDRGRSRHYQPDQSSFFTFW
jgi:hypothetical protein